ncbi:MAG: FUSC family protein [Acidobacteria bacterium]|nr:FUSC family protein [Acidobacteriota bacterium]
MAPLARLTVRERFQRLWAATPRIAIAALAAAVSYFLAHEVFGHASPFFAPVSAVIVLGITIGAQLQRALQLALGVALGILAADLLVAVIGNGGWQIGIVVFAAMCLAVFAGGDQLAVRQAAAGGLLVSVAAIPGDPAGVARFGDAAIGAAVALIFNFVIFPVNPLKMARRAVDPALKAIAGVLDQVAEALEKRDQEAAVRALHAARDLEGQVGHVQATIVTSGEIARLALVRRGQVETVDRYAHAVELLDRAQADVVALAQGAHRAVELGDRIPLEVVAGLRDLAACARHLGASFEDDSEQELARAAAVRAAAATTAGLDETRNLSVSLVVGQARMTAGDFLRAMGIEPQDARATLREVADDSEARSRIAVEAMRSQGLDAEIDAARPGDESS